MKKIKLNRRAALAGAAFFFATATPGAHATESGAWFAPTIADCLVRVTPSGSIVQTVYGFYEPQDIDIYERDGSVWVVEPMAGRLKKMTKEGSIVKTITGLAAPARLVINQSDGSIWVTEFYGGAVSRWSRGGALLSRTTGIAGPVAIAVNRYSGVAWTCDWEEGELVKISPTGSIMWREPEYRLRAAAVLESTGQCYIAGWYRDWSGLFLVNPDGTQEWKVDNHMAGGAWHVRVDPVDGSCWFGSGAYAARYSRNGVLELETSLPISATGLDLIPFDRSVWFGGWDGRYVRLSRAGSIIASGVLPQRDSIDAIAAYAGDVGVAPASLGEVKALFK